MSVHKFKKILWILAVADSLFIFDYPRSSMRLQNCSVGHEIFPNLVLKTRKWTLSPRNIQCRIFGQFSGYNFTNDYPLCQKTFQGTSESCGFSCWCLQNTGSSCLGDFHQSGWAREPCKAVKIGILGNFRPEVFTTSGFSTWNWSLPWILQNSIHHRQAFQHLYTLYGMNQRPKNH